MLYFKYKIILWLLLFLPFLFFFLKSKNIKTTKFSKRVLEKIELKSSQVSRKIKTISLIISLGFLIIAIARPVINNGEIKINKNFISAVVAIDISNSMFANDIYPNRFEFAKEKFFNMLSFLKNEKIALVGFSTRTFLISPLTKDFESLKFLAKNMRLDFLNLRGTNFLALLDSVDKLMDKSKNKIVIIFSDGGDKSDFSKEINYAKTHNITIFVYAIGSKKGGIIKTKQGILKDKNDNIVVVKLNPNIKNLALQTGGAYMKYTLKKDDVSLIAKAITSQFKAKKEEDIIKDEKELFYIPLLVSIAFFFLSSFGLELKAKSIKLKAH